ncbi:MAG: tetratricopeptide repeat protein [Xanthobacteraceae bacterium]|jgi:tetratricopeptide (TPR) repeat protein
MRKNCLLAAALLISVAIGAPQITKAMDNPSPSPPSNPPSGNTTTSKQKTKSQKPKPQNNSSLDDFYSGWHKAYALVYDKSDYEGGIAVLRAMGYDDNADVATLIGYASRKLGRYDDAQYWYDRALAADPNHALTWSYYGMWQAEQGNLLKAKDDLQKVASICGTECREYTELKAVIDGTKTY